jgi:hypothetical protein
MDDIPLGQLVPLALAVKTLPGRRPGKAISRSTLERWRTKGVGGIVLRTVRVGGTVCTCDAWIREFIERLNARRPPSPAPEVRGPSERGRAAAEARARLEAAWAR